MELIQKANQPTPNRTNPNSTYIKIGLKFKNYKSFHLHAYVDTGASLCIASKYIIPNELWKEADPLQVTIANGDKLKLNNICENIFIEIENVQFFVPRIYQQQTGMDFIIGNNFCRLYQPFIQTIDKITFHYQKTSVSTKIMHYALRIASKGFIESLKKQKRGDKAIISSAFKTFNPQNIVSIQCSNSESSEETEINDFIFSITEFNKIEELLDRASGENPIDPDKNTNGELAEIVLKDQNKVIRVKPMAYTPTDREELSNQVKELLQLKVIRPSKSPHSSPCFLVRNHSEIKRGKARMVINYKSLNDNTIDDGYYLPNKETIIASLRGKTYFSGLDCKSGFWQIRLKEESKPLTAFSCPLGQYEWNVVPFGLKQAPGLFQRFMDNSFKDLHKFCMVYVDDILVYSDNYNDHIKHLKIVLERCLEKGIVLSKKKAELCKKEINYLGLIISHGNIKMQNHVLENIQKFPDKIESKVQLQRFLGCLTYAESYISRLAELRKPLQAKLKKTAVWSWTDNDSNYFRKVKAKVKNLPTLHHPEPHEFLIIETDASDQYWGGILKSKNTDGIERLCRYTSGSFQNSELNYHSNEKEILAIKKTISKFKIYLIPNRFLIRTDNKNFKSFLKIDLQNDYKQGRLVRWQQWFNYYKFDVEHIEGIKNSLPDSLTRELALSK